ncbi:hypothetical protein PCANC_06516 [Puccinia coronata f. sp. avenae]|uniref:Uncharacterized protein n=1 Tax=Puccinia coronata f. sp. avenae TaxID=200324 RepID=A0A2N5VAE6_9BASI|nr:hypothetical protein PCANC_06516 [Puccinia coronata f. sp. avenae]
MIRKSSFLQISASLLVLVSVKCLPATSDPAQDGISKTMGQVHESACKGNTMLWTKSNTNWQSLKLADSFTLYQNVWQGDKVLDGGKSEIICDSFQQGSLAWRTDFAMPSAPQDDNQVKAYTNVAWAGDSIQLKQLNTFNTVWDWKLSNESKDLVADVSYDIFLASHRECKEQKCASREVMIWLSAINGAKPAGTRVGTIQVGSEQFQVWQGTVNVPVVSIFPVDADRQINSFKADFKELLKKLDQFGVLQDEYIVSVGAGVEIFKGSGNLTTSKYTIELY